MVTLFGGVCSIVGSSSVVAVRFRLRVAFVCSSSGLILVTGSTAANCEDVTGANDVADSSAALVKEYFID